MAAFFGFQENVEAKIKASLLAAGIQKRECAPSTLRPFGIFEREQPGYALYRSNLPAFIQAYIHQKPYYLNQPGYPSALRFDEPLMPITFPSVITQFRGIRNLRSEDDAQLKSRFGYTTLKNRPDNYYILGKNSSDDLNWLLNAFAEDIVEENSPIVVNGVANISGLKVAVIINKILTSFLCVNQYPAFHATDMTEISDDHPMNKIYQRLDLETVGPESTAIYSGESLASFESGESHQNTNRRYRRYAAVSTINRLEREELYDLADGSTTRGTEFARPGRAAQMAFLTENTQLPNESGLLIGFHLDLALQDHITVPTVIRQYFFKSLGSTPLEQRNTFSFINRHWPHVMNTEMGHVLTHIASCIDLSLQTQTRCLPIFHLRTYVGSVLLGARFSVSIDNVLYGPLPTDELKQSIADSNAHFTNLIAIVALLNSKSDVLEDLEVANISGIRQLNNRINQVRGSLTEVEKDNIKLMAGSLSFHPYEYPVTKARVSEVLKIIIEGKRTKNETIDLGIPLAPSLILETDFLTLCLGAFGDTPPNPLTSAGTAVSLEANPGYFNTVESDDLFSLIQSTPKLAAKNWESFLKSGHTVNNPKVRVASSKFKTFAGKDRVDLLTLVAECVQSGVFREEVGKGAQVAGKKRPRDEGSAIFGVGKKFRF